MLTGIIWKSKILFFQKFYPHKCKQYIVCNYFTAKMILNRIKIFLLILFKMEAKRLFQTWTEVGHQNFDSWEVQTMWNLQKNVSCVWKTIFWSKEFYKWACLLESESKRQFIKWKHIDSPVKKELWEQGPVKKVMLKAFQEMNGLTTNDFPEKEQLKCFWLPTPYMIFPLFIK